MTNQRAIIQFFFSNGCVELEVCAPDVAADICMFRLQIITMRARRRNRAALNAFNMSCFRSLLDHKTSSTHHKQFIDDSFERPLNIKTPQALPSECVHR